MESRPRIAVITGPTASGKSALALSVAQELGAHIVSADSMQVYRGLDIGTAKPTPGERALVPHHLIDVADIEENYNAGRFRLEAGAAIKEIAGLKKPCLVVGGTILYIKVLLEGLLEAPPRDDETRSALQGEWEAGGAARLYEELQKSDPVLAARLHPNDKTRILRGLEVFRLTGERLSSLQEGHGFGGADYDARVFAVRVPRDLLYRRINERVGLMLGRGWIDEVRGVLAQGHSPELAPLKAIGYREIVEFIVKGGGGEELCENIAKATRHFAKRQETWLRKLRAEEIGPDDSPYICREIKKFLQIG